MSILDKKHDPQPTTFEECIELVLINEGGDKISGHPADPGGITKYGITSKYYPAVNIKDLRLAEAMVIYQVNYWDKYKVESLPSYLRYIYLDMLVNQGPRGAGKVLQKTINYFLNKINYTSLLKIDGMVGPNTIRMLNEVIIDLGKIRSYRILYYSERILAKPIKEVFMEGWFDRAIRV